MKALIFVKTQNKANWPCLKFYTRLSDVLLPPKSESSLNIWLPHHFFLKNRSQNNISNFLKTRRILTKFGILGFLGLADFIIYLKSELQNDESNMVDSVRRPKI